MRAKLQTFKSGNGDCIFLRLFDGDNCYHIMIDCGDFTEEIESFVQTHLQNHIHLLIVTHIDFDHVDGLCKMLRVKPTLRIDKILYNCYQYVTGERLLEISEGVRKDVEKLTANLPPQRVVTDGKVNMEHASVLASLILSNPQWSEAWFKAGYIHKNTAPIALGERWGQLVFLSPLEEDLLILDKDFAREYLRLTKHRLLDVPFTGQETLFELVSRLVLMQKLEKERNAQKKKISRQIETYTEEIWVKAKNFEPAAVSKENKASLAFVWEFGDTRILFLGDAHPDVVRDSIEEKYNSLLNLKAVKVSHHGSKHSTSISQMKVIDSADFFITGGNVSDKPSLEMLSKIVDRADERQRTLHFNYDRNQLMKDIGSQAFSIMRERYHFNITSNNELEFEY